MTTDSESQHLPDDMTHRILLELVDQSMFTESGGFSNEKLAERLGITVEELHGYVQTMVEDGLIEMTDGSEPEPGVVWIAKVDLASGNGSFYTAHSTQERAVARLNRLMVGLAAQPDSGEMTDAMGGCDVFRLVVDEEAQSSWS